MGKSQMIETSMAAANRYCHVEVLSISDPCDIGGLLFRDGNQASRLLPAWFIKLKEAGNGCLFLDELTTCPQMNQAGALRLVRSNAINGDTLPASTLMMAAANPPEMAANGCPLSAPMANRFCHLDWKPSATAWARGLLGGFQPMPLPELSPDWEAKHLAAARGKVSGFITVQPMLLQQLPTSDDARSKAWPSPRTWDYVTRVMAACADLKLSADPYIAGLVGSGAELAFTEWLVKLDLPDPEEVLRHPKSALVRENDGAYAYTVCGALVSAMLAQRSTERYLAGWTYMQRCMDAGYGDVVAGMVAELFRHKDPNRPHFKGLEKLSHLFQKAGM